MDELMDDLGRNLSCPAVLGRILRDACESGLIAEHLNALVKGLTRGQEAHLRQTNARSMIVAQRDYCVLQVRRIGGDMTSVDKLSDADRFVHTPPSNSVLLIKECAPVTVNRYRLPEGTDRTAFAADIPLERLESERYDGSVVVEGYDDMEFRDYVCESGHAWMIRLNYPKYANETWFFDKETLRSAFSSAVLPEFTSLVNLCRVFAASHDEGAKPLVEELAAHQAHFVRWAAVQAMGQIDGERAREMIVERCEDPHPHVRAAALRAREKFWGDVHGRHIRS